MKEKKPSEIIPGQQTGKAMDSKSVVDEAEEKDVKAFIAEVKI